MRNLPPTPRAARPSASDSLRPALVTPAVLPCLLLAASLLLAVLPAVAATPLGFADRVACQTSLERVRWEQRTWPDGNPKPKPPLEEVLPQEALMGRTEDTLRLSALLEVRWGRPLAAADLQGELDRITATTAAPEQLEELLAALGHDPRLVAECLARPLLADRLAREAFAWDPEIHGEVGARARREAARLRRPADLLETSGRHHRVVLARTAEGDAGEPVLLGVGEENRLLLDPATWSEMTGQLLEDFGRLETGTVGPLVERDDRFAVQAVAASSEDRLEIVSAVWPKRDFEEWWREVRGAFPARVVEPLATFRLTGPDSPNASPNSWLTVGTGGSPPSARAYHTAVWTGNEMIVWGGGDSMGIYWGGSRWSPATNSWTAMTNTGHPDARQDHTAVWAGVSMIVWGGYGSAGLLATGGTYNALTNTWSALPTSGAPSARRYHAAGLVQSGYMVIWGGSDGANHLGDGKRYSLATGNWLSVASTGAPSARSRAATASFTAASGTTRLFVWGGEGPGGVLGDGASFDTAWHALPSASAPAARTAHSAVVVSDGSPQNHGVIVWGGSNGTSSLTTGGIYNVFSNQWKATATSGAPAGRQAHTAVWTNSTMMVWGGHTSSGELRNTGGVFNPYNSVWKPITTTGAPTARKGHTAIWHPSSTTDVRGRMVVWGGWDGGYRSDGGRYEEPTDFLLRSQKSQIFTVPGAYEPLVTTAHVQSLGDFAGPVSLSCQNFPGSCVFSVNPATPDANGSVASHLTLMVTYPLGTGTVPFSLVGSDGVTTRSYAMTAVVQDYSIGCSPSTVSAPQGGQASTTCTISASNGFSDPVSLSCTPHTCTFSPNPVTPPAGGSVTSQLTVQAGSTPGTSVVEVAAASHGAIRLFNVTLVVTAASPAIFSNGFESGGTAAWSAKFP